MIPIDVRAARDRHDQIRALVSENHAVIIQASGYAPVEWSNVMAKIAGALTELREAERAAYAFTHEDWTKELLDAAMRFGGILVGLCGLDWHVRENHPELIELHVHFAPIEVTLWHVLRPACDAMQAWRDGLENRARVQFCLEKAFGVCLALYEESSQQDAVDGLRATLEYNRTRPYLHGHRETLA